MPTLKVKIDGEWQQVLGGSNGNGSIELDPTLSYPGMAADAFAVGEKIGDISTLVTEDKRSLTNAINELASSNKNAFIVTFDLDMMTASHNSTQIIEAAKAGSIVIGQIPIGDTGTLNCYLNTALPFEDSDDTVEFIFLIGSSNQIHSIKVSKDYSFIDSASYFSTIDEITGATKGQIPVLNSVGTDGNPIGWTTVDLPEGVTIDETLAVSGAAADSKTVGDKFNEINNIIIQAEEPTEVEEGMLWLDTDASESNSLGSVGSIFIGDFTINSSNVTITANDAGGGTVQLGSDLLDQVDTIFNACSNYNLPLTIQLSISDMIVAFSGSYVSGSTTLNVYKNIQFIGINNAITGVLSLYSVDEYGLIRTNDDSLIQALNAGIDVNMKFYVNNDSMQLASGEEATF